MWNNRKHIITPMKQHTNSLVKASYHNILATRRTHSYSKLMLIIFTTVVKMLEAAAISAIGNDTFITACSHYGILRECQGIWW